MAQEPLSNLSNEELKKRAKALKVTVGFFGCAILIMAISGIIVTIKKGFSATSVTPIAFLPLFIIFYVQLRQVNTELKKRAK